MFDPLIEECIENIDETKLVKKTLDKNDNKDRCNSCVLHKMLFWIFFILFIISIGIGIGIYFACFRHLNCNKYNLPY